MHGRYGQTAGKMVTKVRVVDFHMEGKISFRQAWLRESIPMVLALSVFGYHMFTAVAGVPAPAAVANGDAPPADKLIWPLAVIVLLWYLAEVLTTLIGGKSRALHDFIAGTFVIRTNTREQAAQRDPLPNTDSVDALPTAD